MKSFTATWPDRNESGLYIILYYIASSSISFDVYSSPTRKSVTKWLEIHMRPDFKVCTTI